MEEIWKDVKGFESLYMVSNLGRVKNVPHYVTRKYYRPSTGDNIEDKLYIKEVLLNPKKKYHHKDRGIYNYFYYGVSLRKDGKYYNKSIHRLVAEAFLPNPDNLIVQIIQNGVLINTIMFGKIDQLKVQKRLMQILKIEGKYINIQKMEHSLKNMNL